LTANTKEEKEESILALEKSSSNLKQVTQTALAQQRQTLEVRTATLVRLLENKGEPKYDLRTTTYICNYEQHRW